MVNLPLACIGLDIGRKISASMGEVEVVDMDGEGIGWENFFEYGFLLICQNHSQEARSSSF
jgi:hypothetical protein